MKSFNIIPVSLFSLYCDYLCNWSEGHLCRATIEYINLTCSDYAIGYAAHDETGPVSISIASKTFPFAAIATRPDKRGQGLAKKVLKQTINHFRLAGLVYETWVAADNPSSIVLLESVGLRKVREETKNRRSTGEYLAFKYSSKNT